MPAIAAAPPMRHVCCFSPLPFTYRARHTPRCLPPPLPMPPYAAAQRRRYAHYDIFRVAALPLPSPARFYAGMPL